MQDNRPVEERQPFALLDDDELADLMEEAFAELARRAHFRSHGEEAAA